MKPNNLAGIYVVLISISSVSFILLPVGLELGVEITHNAESSTAILWSGGNLVSVLWVLGAIFFPLGYLNLVADGSLNLLTHPLTHSRTHPLTLALSFI